MKAFSTIVIIAWRNVWRNYRRSLVVMIAVAMGVLAIVSTVSFSDGMYRSLIKNAIRSHYSHIQIEHPQFSEDQELKYTLKRRSELENFLVQNPSVQGASFRLICSGMLSTSRGAIGTQLIGINPQDEAKLTDLNSKLIEGEYLDEDDKNKLLVSRSLADKLKLKIKSKLVITVRDSSGELISSAYKVKGIFETNNSTYDITRVYIPEKQIAKLVNQKATHQLALFLTAEDYLVGIQGQLAAQFPGLSVRNWREIAPELELIETSSKINLYIISAIIMLALLFSIVNTMLMAVLERGREIGVLMAVGMNRLAVFLMVVFETIFLTLAGAPIGMLMGFSLVYWLGKRGIDLSAYSGALNKFGIEQLVYPEMHWQNYLIIAVIVAVTAFVSSIFPAFRAIRVLPVEAIRKI